MRKQSENAKMSSETCHSVGEPPILLPTEKSGLSLVLHICSVIVRAIGQRWEQVFGILVRRILHFLELCNHDVYMVLNVWDVDMFAGKVWNDAERGEGCMRECTIELA